MTFYQYPDYMYHYGVKGMKWGIRKAYNTSGVRLHSKTMKKGYEFQNISKDNRARQISNKNALYVSHKPSDNKTYRNMYWWFGDQPVKNTITAKKDVRIAGKSVSQREFVKMCAKNGKAIADDMGNQKYDFSSNKSLAAKAKGAKWVKNEGYKDFVRQYTEGMGATHQEFNKRMNKKGYDAIYDIYDIAGGYSKEPLIFFSPNDSVKVSKSERYKYDK